MREPCHSTLLLWRPTRIRATNNVLIRLVQNDFVTNSLIPIENPIANFCILPTIHNFVGVINTKCCKMLKSVDRPLEVISVNDICKNAGISRQTFYNHFESKYMLRSWWSEYCEQFSLDRIGIDLSWEEASIRYAQLMLSPGNFIFKSASNNRAESEPYEKILVERRVNALRKACSYRNVEIAPDLEYAMHHYAQSFRLCGNEISAAGESSFKGINEISRCFILIVPAILYDVLQLPQFKKRSQLENYNLIDSIVWKVLNQPMPTILL